MKLKIGELGGHGMLISNFKSKMLFLCVVVGPTLNKKVTVATRKDLSVICKFQNLANIYLRKVTKFQGYGFCQTRPHLPPSPLPPAVIGISNFMSVS